MFISYNALLTKSRKLNKAINLRTFEYWQGEIATLFRHKEIRIFQSFKRRSVACPVELKNQGM